MDLPSEDDRISSISGRGNSSRRRFLRQYGDIKTIGQAARHYVAAVCELRDHWDDLSLERLLQQHGAAYPLIEVCRRLTCRYCKKRGASALLVDYSRRLKKRRGEPPADGLALVRWEDV